MTNRLAGIVAICGMACAAFGVDRAIRRSTDSPPTLASTSHRVSPTTCYECHSDIAAKYVDAPHNRTLRRGNDPESLAAFVGKSVVLDGHEQGFVQRDGQLFATHAALPTQRRVDWVFGSGHHAMTPVTIETDPEGHPRLIQFQATLMADGALGATPGLGVTVGDRQPPASDSASPPMHGSISDPAETRRCFGCHVSALPEQNGRIDLDRLIAGVDCTRCHPGAAAHARSGGTAVLTLDWANLTPWDAINRCGECHRRADEFTPDELRPEWTHLVRFAPVGMAMSRCFAQSQLDPSTTSSAFPRFDCVTCHDPHAPASTDAAHYNQTCFLCHQPAPSPPLGETAGAAQRRGPTGAREPVTDRDQAADRNSGKRIGGCSVAPPTSSCIDCHMPKRESGEGLFFTDHWIRIHPHR